VQLNYTKKIKQFSSFSLNWKICIIPKNNAAIYKKRINMTQISNFTRFSQTLGSQIFNQADNLKVKLAKTSLVAIAILFVGFCFYKIGQYAMHRRNFISLTPPQFRIKLSEAKDEILTRMFSNAAYAEHSAAKIFVQVGTADHFVVNRTFVLNRMPTRELIDGCIQSIFNGMEDLQAYPRGMHFRIGMLLKRNNNTIARGTGTKDLFDTTNAVVGSSQNLRNSLEYQEDFCRTHGFPFQPFALQ
jgi:hypothetical protein